SKDFAESVGSGVRHADVRRAVEREIEEQLFLVAAGADFAEAEGAAVAVRDERIFDAALREEIVLRADEEEVLERAAAELHHVAEEDLCRTGALACPNRALLDRVDHRRVVEAQIPRLCATEELRTSAISSAAARSLSVSSRKSGAVSSSIGGSSVHASSSATTLM